MTKNKLLLLIDLSRLNRPIGIYLLLWPTLCALWAAHRGLPELKLLLIFIAGVIVMRSAGCIINDIADAHWDKWVERTQDRPLASGKLNKRTAFIAFIILCGVALALVCLTNWLSIKLAFIAFVLACLYPFTKRFTYFPQLFLGAAFSMGIPIAYAATLNQVPLIAWLFYGFNLLWTLAYDTQYAVVDFQDDLKVGIKSTAVFFNTKVQTAIVGLQLSAWLLLLAYHYLVAQQVSTSQSTFLYMGNVLIGLFFVYQYRLTREREGSSYFKAFLNNHWAGFYLFISHAVCFLIG